MYYLQWTNNLHFKFVHLAVSEVTGTEQVYIKMVDSSWVCKYYVNYLMCASSLYRKKSYNPVAGSNPIKDLFIFIKRSKKKTDR